VTTLLATFPSPCGLEGSAPLCAGFIGLPSSYTRLPDLFAGFCRVGSASHRVRSDDAGCLFASGGLKGSSPLLLAPFLRAVVGAVRLADPCARLGRVRAVVAAHMVWLVRELKVLNAVVRLVSIDVMNNLVALKEAAKVLFHDKAVRKDVAIPRRARVVWRSAANVPLMQDEPAIPSGVVGTKAAFAEFRAVLGAHLAPLRPRHGLTPSDFMRNMQLARSEVKPSRGVS
jgi:hypothetical protein